MVKWGASTRGALSGNGVPARMSRSGLRSGVGVAGLLAVALGVAVTLGAELLAREAAGQEGAALPGGAGEPPIPTKSLLAAFFEGGPLMYPIALCSFALVVFVLERGIALRRGRVIPRPFVRRFLEQLAAGQLDRDKALALCAENRSPVAEVFAAAVKKWGRTSVEVEQAILDAGERVNNQLRRYLRLMSGISQVAPLLGLLGTVLGMIVSFNGISASTDAAGQRALLAGGIAQALITTAAGMVVAIPALTAYLYFVGRVDRLIMEIDALGQRIVELISAEALAEARSGRRAKAA